MKSRWPHNPALRPCNLDRVFYAQKPQGLPQFRLSKPYLAITYEFIRIASKLSLMRSLRQLILGIALSVPAFGLPLLMSSGILLLSACSSIPLSKPQSPNVTIAGIRPTKISLSSQTLELTLNIQNPNGFDLPMESLTFSARFAGESFAQGNTINKVTIPANGEALLKVSVKTGLGQLAEQFKTMVATDDLNLHYDIKGFVKLANWPKNIPINVEGELEDPRRP